MPNDKSAICAVCGKVIKNRRNKMFCSYKCAGLYKQNYAICPICGVKFKKSPSDAIKTCGSEDCKREWRKKITGPEQAKRMHGAISTSPLTGHFETNHHAVEWTLVSPSGEVYEFKNLALWVEQHADLLPISERTGERVLPQTFKREVNRLKSDNEKYTIFREDYHGWKVLKNKEGKNGGKEEN